MVGFYCVTLFHIFLSVLLRQKYFADSDAVIYIVTPLGRRDANRDALLNCGFCDVVFLENEMDEKGKSYKFENVMFYSLYCACHNYLKSLDHEKLVLVYEGITSYQLNHWSAGDSSKRFDLHEDIDEFWFPDVELLLDKEYLPKCKEFSISINQMTQMELFEICKCLNAVFDYEYRPLKHHVLFMDRYLAKYSSFVRDVETEEFLTQAIYYGAGGNITIKKHPYDQNYAMKYRGLDNVHVIEDDVPWELIYLNHVLENMRKKDIYQIGDVQKGDVAETEKDIYLIYNSFAPANLALLFGNYAFKCICVEPILDKYSDIERTYLNSDITNLILKKFAQKYGIEIKFVSKIDEFSSCTADVCYSTDDNLWEHAEKVLKEKNIDDILEIRSFRLQMDCALVSSKKKSGKYYFNVDNSSADISRLILGIALPQFTETQDAREGDIIIDCNRTLADYTNDMFDIRHFSIVEGCFRLTEQETEIEALIKNVDNIYIWGTARTNKRTFSLLHKLRATCKIRMVFDSYASGTNHGFPIVKFTPELVKNNSFIFVCAGAAYHEIAQILLNAGFAEGTDFTLGVGINHV